MKPLLHIMLLLALIAPGSLARAAPFALPGSQVFSLPDPVTDTPYEVIVTLPGGYDPKAAKRYPVFYYLDAYWDAPLLQAITGQQAYDRTLPSFIATSPRPCAPPSSSNIGSTRKRPALAVRPWVACLPFMRSIEIPLPSAATSP